MLHDQRGFADVIRATGLKIRRISWIIWAGPILSHESLKAENLLWLEAEKMLQKGKPERVEA